MKPKAIETPSSAHRIACGHYPTPLEELTRLRKHFGPDCPRIFIKRDDYLGTGFGSNKLRKLEYAIGHELANGTETIVTIAGEKSNHARVTAAVCARYGLRCVLVLNRSDERPPAGLVFGTRFLYELYGAEVFWVDSREVRESTAMRITEELRKSGRRASFLPLGVSFPLGALGFVDAWREVSAQFASMGLVPSSVYHSGTSGGTQAGLIAGTRIFNHDVPIVAVSPDDPAEEIQRRVFEIATGVLQLFGDHHQAIKPNEIKVLDEFVGEGYGVSTPAATEATKLLARLEAVILDPVYTSKAMAALIAGIDGRNFDSCDNVVFWHTGGQLAWFYSSI